MGQGITLFAAQIRSTSSSISVGWEVTVYFFHNIFRLQVQVLEPSTEHNFRRGKFKIGKEVYLFAVTTEILLIILYRSPLTSYGKEKGRFP